MNSARWLSGTVPMYEVWGITAYLFSGTYHVQANAPSTLGAGSFELGEYSTAADVNTAVAAFIENEGAPWIAIGDAGNIPSEETETDQVLALNFGSNFVPVLADGTTCLTVTSNREIVTAGLEPWGSYAEAWDAIMAITGNATWPA